MCTHTHTKNVFRKISEVVMPYQSYMMVDLGWTWWELAENGGVLACSSTQVDQIKCIIKWCPDIQTWERLLEALRPPLTMKFLALSYASYPIFTQLLLFSSQIVNWEFHQLIKMSVYFVSISLGKEGVWLRSFLSLWIYCCYYLIKSNKYIFKRQLSVEI